MSSLPASLQQTLSRDRSDAPGEIIIYLDRRPSREVIIGALRNEMDPAMARVTYREIIIELSANGFEIRRKRRCRRAA
jgi:hypothetical protein